MIWVMGGAVALAVGVWLGMPGDRIVSEQESIDAFENGGDKRRLTKRSFMWLDYMYRKKSQSKVRERAIRNSRRRPFELDG